MGQYNPRLLLNQVNFVDEIWQNYLFDCRKLYPYHHIIVLWDHIMSMSRLQLLPFARLSITLCNKVYNAMLGDARVKC